MKVGIILHSYTGHTLSVVKKLEDKLSAAGHSVTIERLEPVGGENTNVTDISKIKLSRQPDVNPYDTLVFAAPVRGFSISPVLSACLSKIESLKNKKTVLLVTEFFPFPWMGGNRAISQMKTICESKGSKILGTGIVNWKGTHRDKKIADLVENLSRLL